MIDYFKRVITYDQTTKLYTCECPEIGLKVVADTEMSVIVDMRKEIERESPRLAQSTGLGPGPMINRLRKMISDEESQPPRDPFKTWGEV